MDTQSVQDFIAEAEEIVDLLGAELSDLVDLAERGGFSIDILNSIFRGAHSLKGLAGMFGFTGITGLAHAMESLLDRLRMGRISLLRQPLTVLTEGHELLAALVRTCATEGTSDISPEVADCIARLTACGEQPDGKHDAASRRMSEVPGHILSSLTEYEESRLKVTLDSAGTLYVIHASFDLNSFDTELPALTKLLKEMGEVICTLPSVAENRDDAIDFELLYGSDHSVADVQSVVERDGVRVVRLGSSATPVRETGVSALQGGEESSVTARSMSRTVRVDIGKLDQLMNIVGELVLAHTSIAGTAEKLRSEGISRPVADLGAAVKLLDRKLADLQRGVMEIRMVPVSQLYEKLARIVRKIARDQGKTVELSLHGGDTELDKLIVEELSDPLIHIIRNAIDHGIEPARTRVERGKRSKGNVRISAYQKGNKVVIEVADDGGGIDVDKVKRTALDAGLVTDVDALSDRDAINLIFLPGFTTSDGVSEISGRGVGMDVVKNNIAAISGMIDVESRPGEGSCFTITLPITLAIIKALIVSSCGRSYALPVTAVQESLLMNSSAVATVERNEMFRLRDATVPLLRLDRYFDITRNGERPGEFYVVVVGAAEKRLGIVVDDLICQRDIVIKPLGDAFARISGIAGAADLEEQRTILVLDVSGIINDTLRPGG